MTNRKMKLIGYVLRLLNDSQTSEEKMLYVIVGAVLLYIVYGGISAIVNAPEGWEDEEGFHTGKRN
jgi:hypothetical protein